MREKAEERKNMDEEIEMNDLLGHAEEIVSSSSVENDQDPRRQEQDQDKGIGPGVGLGKQQRRKDRRQMNCCLILVITILLMGTVFYLANRIYFARAQMDGLLETYEKDKKQVNVDAEHDIDVESTEIVDNNYYNFNATNAQNEALVAEDPSKQPDNCIDDPDFRLRNNPKRNCDWVAQNHNKVCSRQRVKQNCPVACGDCVGVRVKSEGKNNENTKIQSTIVAGIDDQDTYCEDLSQYKEWHEIRISKDDGKMFNVVKQMTHDKGSFTQGLTYARGTLFESAGLYGKSTVRILDSETGSVEKIVSLIPKLFAEGIAYYKDSLVQITWKSQLGFLYNIKTLEETSSFKFETTLNEGWGITWDRCKDELIVTDGSENLHFWDPRTLKEIRRISVNRMDGLRALELNEIEFWRGRVLANVWFEDVVLVIDPETGTVEKEYDFSELWPKLERKKFGADVLNGISISGDPDILYFTGKLWDRMFKIQLLPGL